MLLQDKGENNKEMGVDNIHLEWLLQSQGTFYITFTFNQDSINIIYK